MQSEYTVFLQPEVICDVCERGPGDGFIMFAFGKAKLAICGLCVAALAEAQPAQEEAVDA